MNLQEVAALVRPNIARLCPYSTARDEYKGPLGVFLDANESPYPTGFNRYPDPHQKALKARLSEIKGVPAESIFIGNGSDEAIDMVFRVFCEPGRDNVVAIEPSYGMYSVCADINDVEVRSVALGADFSLPAEAVLAACDAHTKAIFLCSPNNPSGNAFPREQLMDIVRRARTMVVVDEAYIDFCQERSLRFEVETCPNLIVYQTLSKAWGMAGLRLGLAFAHPSVIARMSQVKYPYNISALTQQTVLEALSHPIDAQVAEIVSERARVAREMASLPCVKHIYPSQANFLLVKVGDADALYGHLIADGVIVRNRNKVKGCAGCLRITIGLKDENDRMLQSLRTFREAGVLPDIV